MDKHKLRTGWIGAGAMGRPICRRLLAADVPLAVHDRQPERAAALAAEGARAETSIAGVCAGADIVFSMVFDDQALRDVVLAPGGLLAAARPGLLFVDMSTVTPGCSAGLAGPLEAAGVKYLRAPVSGTTVLAESGTLTVFASGPRDGYEDCLPLLRLFSARQNYLGGGEAARIVKLLINMILIASTATLGEALTLGERAGLDRSLMIDAINDSVVGSVHYRTRADSLKTRRYTRNGPLSLAEKDLDMTLRFARSHEVTLPIAEQVRGMLATLAGRGLDELEISVLADFINLAEGRHGIGEMR